MLDAASTHPGKPVIYLKTYFFSLLVIVLTFSVFLFPFLTLLLLFYLLIDYFIIYFSFVAIMNKLLFIQVCWCMLMGLVSSQTQGDAGIAINAPARGVRSVLLCISLCVGGEAPSNYYILLLLS